MGPCCSFCRKPGHRWPTCRKKFAVDGLAHRIVAAIVNDELARILGGKRLPAVMLAASATVLNAYNRGGERWHLTLKPLRLQGRRAT